MLRDRQHAIVGEGLALSCVHLGWSALPVLMMESQFATAWHGWRRRKVFPGVFVECADNDWTCDIMLRSDSRPGRLAFWTDRSGAWMPQIEEGWTPQQVAGRLASAHQLQVTFDDWLDLAAAFADRAPRRGGWLRELAVGRRPS